MVEETIKELEKQLKEMKIKMEAPSLIASVGVKLPQFWHSDPELWFKQVEAQFELSRITIEQTKYNYILSALDSSTLSIVSDILKKKTQHIKH